MASLYEQQEELLKAKPKALRLARATPLPAKAERARDKDLDPQIVWNGVKISLTPEQRQLLVETGEIEIGDAQLVWRGKDQEDWSDLIVNAPPIYIQEKISPKVLINDLKRRTAAGRAAKDDQLDLYADFNGLPGPEAAAEAYQHPMHWQNRFILGDSLQVMASLVMRENLRGKVQCIYFDPPYGIKFNSNWQVSTQSRDVKDGKREDLSREPEQIKAFRDTWKDGIHSYLTYLRDRLSVARELLTESGSIFVQIGDENVHRVRALMDEVFGEENFCSSVFVLKTTGAGSPAVSTDVLPSVADYVLWYARSKPNVKYRRSYFRRRPSDDGNYRMVRIRDAEDRSLTPQEMVEVDDLPADQRVFSPNPLTSQTGAPTTTFSYRFAGSTYAPGKGGWKTNRQGFGRLDKANRLMGIGKTLRFIRFFDDFSNQSRNNLWDDARQSGFGTEKVYVVQTTPAIIERCILMTTDPGDLVLDPTCGSGTTATVAEQWGRRWITIDTSRVALALARTRLMSARYPYYYLADSAEGRAQEGKITGKLPPQEPAPGNDLRQGFVYERAPHITLKSIANNAEIDVIWETWQQTLEPLRAALNSATGSAFEEWQVPRDAPASWTDQAKAIHTRWWEARIKRQQEIDASIARAADVELLYDRPYEDKSKVRVAGPFTVESLSPHRVVTSRDDTLADDLAAGEGAMQSDPDSVPAADFGRMVLDNLRATGVHQKNKADTIRFSSVEPWPGGGWLAAEARYDDGSGREKRAGILIGPEFGTLTRSQITVAAREASENRFDVLIACAFNFEAQATELERLGPLPILKARMNPDLHMSKELKQTGKGNAFVVFGEPDVTLLDAGDGELQVKVNGVDVFDPSTGEIRSDDASGIAAWFIDTDYNEESFFVRHAYFLGANDPYKSLKTALRAEIDEEAWAALYSDTSRPFPRPSTGRIAVKVINHFGDEVLKVFGV
jgi:adenine-specific DNA-methyltransferase